MESALKSLRSQAPIILMGGLAAFGTYFCMYAFRKPYTATSFEGLEGFAGLDFKIALVISLVLGYALSKFIGIKLISELKAKARIFMLIGLVAVAELALVGFGFVGDHWSAFMFLFLNGLPLGMVWGILFSYLEGRQTSELLGAILCSSFIVSSGAVKSVGLWLMLQFDVSAFWMPAATGALFFIPLVCFAFMLEKVPPPTPEDIALRTERKPMNNRDRIDLLKTVGLGIVGIIVYFIIITAFRDFRDNFAFELWSALGYGDAPAIFTLAEIPIAILALSTMVFGFFIKDSQKALSYYHILIFAATLLILLSTFAFSSGWLDGAVWMVAVGAGLYLAYVPLNAIYFDRLIAAFRHVATAGFLIYLADASGYAGSVGILLIKNFGNLELSWLEFFRNFSYLVGVLGLVAIGSSWWLFGRRLKN
ncbi:MAG: DUF5690 family protein [Opitutales bacterium]